MKMTKLGEALEKLDEVIARLLDPETGCPWDIKQTPKTITSNVLEECYELLEALNAENPDDIREEAGDLLFQVAFIGRLAQARWHFGLTEICDQVRAKMVHRHPHVFGDGAPMADAQAVLNQWQAIKRRDKKHQSLLASVPQALPALQRAHRLSERAGRAGFDWSEAAEVRLKVTEELTELDELLLNYDKKTASEDAKKKLAHEMGDLFFSLVNLSRHLGLHAEEVLTAANLRFIERFQFMEQQLAQEERRPEDATMAELEDLWVQAKKAASV